MVKLIIEDDEGKTTVVPLIRDEISIGRKEGNTIRLTERNVSRRHAKLFKQNGAIFIEDLDSYNGIKINGNRIAGRVAVAEGDRIQIGDYVLGLKLEGASETLTPPAAPLNRTLELPKEELDGTPTSELPAQTEVTEKISTPALRREGPQAKTRQEEYGRLVCVSSNFPGQEWYLDKQLMVLGRTDDNDVVINHRSISRHHARVSEEAGRYTIKDLQSSNGVRVNGEEYEKVELRRGDLIDLGHVRLRFIAPGEDFVFSRDASIVDISKNGSARGGLWLALAAAAVIIAGFFIWRMSGGPPASNGRPRTEDKAALAQQDSTPAQAVEPPAATPPAENLVSAINQAISGEQWSAAIAKCHQLTPEQKQAAQANCEQAAMEMAAHEDFEQAHAAYLQHKYLEVLRHLKDIPEQSTYKARDTQILESSQTKYLAQARAQLEQQAEQGQCEQAEALAGEIGEVVATAKDEAAALVTRCQAVQAATARRTALAQQAANNRRRPRPNPGTKRPPKDDDAPTEQGGSNLEDMTKANEVLQQATNAYVAGNHKRAHTLARQVLTLVPRNTEAIQIIGASSCFLNNAKDAKWAFDRLPSARRNLLKKVCLRNGVTL